MRRGGRLALRFLIPQSGSKNPESAELDVMNGAMLVPKKGRKKAGS